MDARYGQQAELPADYETAADLDSVAFYSRHDAPGGVSRRARVLTS
jgi:hypothetical protein